MGRGRRESRAKPKTLKSESGQLNVRDCWRRRRRRSGEVNDEKNTERQKHPPCLPTRPVFLSLWSRAVLLYNSFNRQKRGASENKAIIDPPPTHPSSTVMQRVYKMESVCCHFATEWGPVGNYMQPACDNKVINCNKSVKIANPLQNSNSH